MGRLWRDYQVSKCLFCFIRMLERWLCLVTSLLYCYTYCYSIDDYSFSELNLVDVPVGTGEEQELRTEEVMEMEPEPEKPVDEEVRRRKHFVH